MQEVHKIIDLADKKLKKNKSLHRGKVLFDLFENEYSHITDKLKNTEYDPSKNDARVIKFLGEIKRQISDY